MYLFSCKKIYLLNALWIVSAAIFDLWEPPYFFSNTSSCFSIKSWLSSYGSKWNLSLAAERAIVVSKYFDSMFAALKILFVASRDDRRVFHGPVVLYGM